MNFHVPGKVALVTGGNRGIGRAIVDALLRHGAAKVYVAVRDPASAADVVNRAAGRALAMRLDLRDEDTIQAAADAADDVELVINNAGVLQMAPPLSPEALDTLDYQLDVNVKGLLRMVQAFAPVLAARGGGAFVQLNSVASLRSFAEMATYCASKAAAYSLTQAIRDALSPHGTLVVSVHPGPIATDMAREAGLGDIAEPPAGVAEAIIAALAAGEFHAFPDAMAREFWQAYEPFARSVVERPADEG